MVGNFRGETIFEYTRLLVGKYLSFFIIFIYIIYFAWGAVVVARLGSEVIKIIFLPKTPIWVFCLSYILIAVYAVTKRLRALARLCELYGLIIIPLVGMIIICIFSQGEILNIKPFIGTDIKTYLLNSTYLSFAFLGIAILLIIPLDKTLNKNIFIYSMAMLFLIALGYILTVEASISVVGADEIIFYDDALVTTIRRIEVPFLNFLRRLDGFAIMLWIMNIFSTVALYLYGSITLLNKSLKQRVSFNHLSLAVLLITLYLSLQPKTYQQVEAIRQYFRIFSIIPVVVIPLVLLIIAEVKKVDKKKL